MEASVDDTVQLVQLKGNEVPGVPPHQIFASITYEHAIGVYSEASLRWVDQYFANDFNSALTAFPQISRISSPESRLNA